MDRMDILKKIISEGGNCCWSRPSICAACPLSQLKVKSNGSFMSCLDAVEVQNLTEEEADAKYLKVATDILLSETIDAIITGGDNGPE